MSNFWGDGLRFRSRKKYPVRNFYDEGGNLVAWYEINPIGDEPSIIIHSEKYLKIKSLNMPKKFLETPTFANVFLAKFMPRRLAETIVKYAIKDLKVKTKNFSLRAYAEWRRMHEDKW